jgi:hypothetical protein
MTLMKEIEDWAMNNRVQIDWDTCMVYAETSEHVANVVVIRDSADVMIAAELVYLGTGKRIKLELSNSLENSG